MAFNEMLAGFERFRVCTVPIEYGEPPIDV